MNGGKVDCGHRGSGIERVEDTWSSRLCDMLAAEELCDLRQPRAHLSGPGALARAGNTALPTPGVYLRLLLPPTLPSRLDIAPGEESSTSGLARRLRRRGPEDMAARDAHRVRQTRCTREEESGTWDAVEKERCKDETRHWITICTVQVSGCLVQAVLSCSGLVWSLF